MPKINYGNYGGSDVKAVYTPPAGYLLKSCTLCGSKAIYYAGRSAFCFDHKVDAIRATQKRTNNESYIMRTMRDPAQPYENEVVG